MESLEGLDKQIDRVKEKKVKDQEEIDKLKTSRIELQDTYYGKLIEYSKLQYLIQDIKWMTDMQTKLVDSKNEKDKRNAEWQERKDKEKKERDERKQKDVERKEREEARRAKEQENKKEMEEQLKQ